MTKLHRVSKDMHDRCLQACWHHKAKLTEAELLALSIVASGWAATEPVTKAELSSARLILDRLGI